MLPVSDTPQYDALQKMNFNQRLAWMKENAQQLRVTGMYFVKVDDRLAAAGYEDGFERMLATFLCFVARPIPPKSSGWCG